MAVMTGGKPVEPPQAVRSDATRAAMTASRYLVMAGLDVRMVESLVGSTEAT